MVSLNTIADWSSKFATTVLKVLLSSDAAKLDSVGLLEIFKIHGPMERDFQHANNSDVLLENATTAHHESIFVKQERRTMYRPNDYVIFTSSG